MLKWITGNFQMFLLIVAVYLSSVLGAGLYGFSQGKKITNADNAQAEKTAQIQAREKAKGAINETDRKNRDVAKYISQKPRNNVIILPDWSDTRKRLHDTYKGDNSQ